jgi:hypothetical protein
MDKRKYVAEAGLITREEQRRREGCWGKNSGGAQETRGKEAPSPEEEGISRVGLRNDRRLKLATFETK